MAVRPSSPTPGCWPGGAGGRRPPPAERGHAPAGRDQHWPCPRPRWPTSSRSWPIRPRGRGLRAGGWVRQPGRHGGRLPPPGRERGVRFLEWTAVTAIRHQGGSGSPASRPRPARSRPGWWWCAGAWSGPLCRALGLEIPARVKAISSVLVSRPPALREPPMVVMDTVQSTYFRSEGGPNPGRGPCFDWDPIPTRWRSGPPGSPRGPATAGEILTHRVPAMAAATLGRGDRAFDYYSADRHAIWTGRRPERPRPGQRVQRDRLQDRAGRGRLHGELIVDGQARTVDIVRSAWPASGRAGPGGPDPYTPRVDWSSRRPSSAAAVGRSGSA